MPFGNFAIEVPERTEDPATAAALTGSAPADVDFTGEDLEVTLVVDGGTPQAIVLDDDYTDASGLLTELNSQTTDATWTKDGSDIFTITSDTTGVASEISWTTDVIGTKSLFITDDDVFGTAAVSEATAIFTSVKGNVQNPEQVLVFNNEDPSDVAAPKLAIGGAGVTYDTAVHISAGASLMVPCRGGDVLYACADDGETVDTRLFITEQ